MSAIIAENINPKPKRVSKSKNEQRADDSYQKFLASKQLIVKNEGFEVDASLINPMLFDHQKPLVQWALRKGRSAVFADTGLGKTAIQLEWSRLLNKKVLILAPLSIARQTEREAKKFGIEGVKYCRNQSEVSTPITITNYEMLPHFDPAEFDGVVLDESSILKNYNAKTRNDLISAFERTPFKLCCTATPAPNDITEIANHSEFLGIMSRVDMLSCFFSHKSSKEDGRNDWSLKGHAQKEFYKWLASWGMSIRKPSDLGFSDEGYDLPPLNILSHFLETEFIPEGSLFADKLHGISDRAKVRKDTIEDRVAKAVELITSSDDQWIAWCGLNDESDLLYQELLMRLDESSGVMNVEGKHSPEVKADRLERFIDGAYKVLITKPSIAGFGMNFQNCHNMVFVGMGDSYEQYYQSIRRCYRFGQTKEVNAHIVLSEPERDIFNNVLRKEGEAIRMAKELVANVTEFEKAEIQLTHIEDDTYKEGEASGEDWRLLLGDSCERMKEIPDNSVDFSIFSPPFASLYTYTPSPRDLGNSKTHSEFFKHFKFIMDELYRIMKPGCVVAIHTQKLRRTKSMHGDMGLIDFPGQVEELCWQCGFSVNGNQYINKNPQAAAIRNKTHSLMFVTLNKDQAKVFPGLPDIMIYAVKPGDREVPVQSGYGNERWIKKANPCQFDIRETFTLNSIKTEQDERHICPLQLDLIKEEIELYTNERDLVFSPFAGIGSEGYMSIKTNRRFLGIELKPEYFSTAVQNLKKAVVDSTQQKFDFGITEGIAG